ncbi:Beta-amylase [Ancistrocladus abbreviatus]
MGQDCLRDFLLDAVSECNTANHAKAIASGLRTLKLLGVDGEELSVWWGVAEKDAMGKYEWECLSFAVDELPVLDGKTPLQGYEDFCTTFMASTITGITMGLGNDGELRSPSDHRASKSSNTLGVGEF